jgi:hypothetical protein
VGLLVSKLGTCARGVAELWLRDSFLSALAARAKIRHVRWLRPGELHINHITHSIDCCNEEIRLGARCAQSRRIR